MPPFFDDRRRFNPGGGKPRPYNLFWSRRGGVYPLPSMNPTLKSATWQR